MTATQTAARTARAGLEKTLDGVARFGALQIRAWEWAAPRSGRPFVGAGRAIASMWALAVPRYDTPAVSQYQAQGRAARGCIGLFLVLLVVPVLALVAAAYIAAQVDSVGGPLAVWAAVAGVVVLLGWYGAPRAVAGAPAAATTEQQQLTRALAAIFPKVNAALREDPSALTIGRPETDYATGTRTIRVGLPYGATARELGRHPEAIAHALRVQADQITVRQGAHPGQATIQVSAQSPADREPPAWELATAPRFDLARPLTIGEDLQGKPVKLALFGTDERGRLTGGSMVIGGVSGSGKTSLMRMIVGTAALDPRAVIAVADLKGDNDFASLAPALDWHRVEDTPENLAELKVMIGQADAHMRAVQAGTADRVPVLIVIDECQQVFGKGRDKELTGMVEQLVRRGRSAGIFVIVATQRPTSDSIPTSLRDNTRDQVCLRVPNQASAAAVIDQLAYEPETDPSRLTADDVGVAVVRAAGFTGKAKLAHVTSAMAGKAARQHPRAPGQLFGQAVPVEEPQAPAAPFPSYPAAEPAVPDPTDTIAHHIEAAWDAHLATTDRVSPDHLAVILAAIDPRYFGSTGDSIRAELRAAGVEAASIKGLIADNPGKTSRGYYRADIQKVTGGVSL